MNATDLVIAPGRLLARTAPRARRTDDALALSPPRGLAVDAITPAPGRVTKEPGLCACGLADDASGQVYNEEAFQYFLSIERKRAEVGGNRLLLALVDLKALAGEDALDGAAPDLFTALHECLRETDFIGWYREPDVAGVVLPQFCGLAPHPATRRVAQRLCHGLGQLLPAGLARRLEVHVYEFPSADQI
jgi:hypothetical protein